VPGNQYLAWNAAMRPLQLMEDHILDVDRLELELVPLMTGTGWQDAGIDTGTLRT